MHCANEQPAKQAAIAFFGFCAREVDGRTRAILSPPPPEFVERKALAKA